MSKGRHRAPHRPVRNLLAGLRFAATLKWYRRRPRIDWNPVEIRHVGLTMTDAVAAATTSYQLAEPCPLGFSIGACDVYHWEGHGVEALNGALTPVA